MVAAVVMDVSAATFLRLKRWPHPRLMRLFLPLVSGTVASVLSGEPLRRPGESAHCVLLDPSRRTELVRAINGECGLGIFLGVEPLEASLHSDSVLAPSALASREPATLRRSDGAKRPGVSVTPAGLVDGRKRMERPNAWPPLPSGLPIFLASASASEKRGSSVQLRWRESDCGAAGALPRASFMRWSERVATVDADADDADGGAEDRGDGDAFLLFLPLEEEGQRARTREAAPGAGSERETERRALWRAGERAAAGSGDRPGRSVPDADAHRLDDDMPRARLLRNGLATWRWRPAQHARYGYLLNSSRMCVLYVGTRTILAW